MSDELRQSAALVRAALLSRLALITALFSAAIAIALLVVWTSSEAYPLEDWPEMQALQKARQAAPADTDLVDEIRRLDALYRSHYLRRQHMLQSGAMLLAAGLLITMGLLRWRGALMAAGPQVPDGGPEFMDRAVAAHHRATGGVLAVGGLILIGLLAAGLTMPEIRRPLAPEGAEDAVIPPNWPQFRGPSGDGHVAESDQQWPIWWDGPSGAGVLWKQALPLESKSSPVVWGDRVFVTAADKDSNLLLCLSADSGDIIWSRKVQSPPPTTSEPGDPPDEGYTGWAAPTPATDGQFVFVTFANADIACFDYDGNQRWVRNYGPARSSWGLASSLITYRNLVIWQLDQGREPEDGFSYLIALEKRSGREVWRRARPVAGSWTTPLVVNASAAGASGDVLLTSGDPHVIAYDAATGTELWRAGDCGTDAAPSPIVAGGLALAVGENTEAFAIRLGGSGELDDSHIAWRWHEALPATVSPLATADYYLQISDNGTMTCLRTSSGELVWQEELKRQAQPSPVLAGNIVYLLMADGTMLNFALGERFELLSRSVLGEKTAASPAFSGGRIFLRGTKHLYCIEGAEPPADGSHMAPGEDQKPQPAAEVFAPPGDDIFGQ